MYTSARSAASRTLLALLVGTLIVGGPMAAPAAAYERVIDIDFPIPTDARYGDGSYRFIDDYHHCRGSNCARRHRATDIMADAGTHVFAARGGTVTQVTGMGCGWSSSGSLNNPPSWGYAVIVAGDDGREYWYLHLGRQNGPASGAYAPGITCGTRVQRGQHIGYVGTSGNATTPHLHLEIHDSRIVDPYGSNRMNPYPSLVEAEKRTTTSLALPPGGLAVAGDWNGDGRVTPGRFQDGIWYLRNSNTPGPPQHVFRFGRAGWLPVVGDWNGDGRDTPGVVSQRQWFIVNQLGKSQPDQQFPFGRPGWKPVAGDWNGNGRDTPAMVAQTRWFITNRLGTSQPDERLDFGRPEWTPVAGDWTGDGRDTPGAVAERTWFLKFTLAGGQPDSTFEYGRPGWHPVAGDWNGNGQDGIGSVAQRTWYLRLLPNANGPVHVRFDY